MPDKRIVGASTSKHTKTSDVELILNVEDGSTHRFVMDQAMALLLLGSMQQRIEHGSVRPISPSMLHQGASFQSFGTDVKAGKGVVHVTVFALVDGHRVAIPLELPLDTAREVWKASKKAAAND